MLIDALSALRGIATVSWALQVVGSYVAESGVKPGSVVLVGVFEEFRNSAEPVDDCEGGSAVSGAGVGGGRFARRWPWHALKRQG